MKQIYVTNGKLSALGVTFSLPENYVISELQKGLGSVLCFTSLDKKIRLHIGGEETEDSEKNEIIFITEDGTYRFLQPIKEIRRLKKSGVCGWFENVEERDFYYVERYRVQDERAHLVIGIHIFQEKLPDCVFRDVRSICPNLATFLDSIQETE